MEKVNTLIIGAQKAGTTSLYEYMRQHPAIHFSKVKEVTFFVKDQYYSKGEDYYHSFFDLKSKAPIKASAYVHMLPCAKCPARVKAYNKDMKFIVLLREPWERAYSSFRYAIKNGWEKEAIDLADSVRFEKMRLESEEYDLTYLSNGKYYEHLSNWMRQFDQEKFFIATNEELQINPDLLLKRLCEFLAIDSSFEFDTQTRYNQSATIKSELLQRLLLTKDSKIIPKIGRLLPSTLRVFIRAEIFSRLLKWNDKPAIKQIERSCAPLPGMTKYFKEDQRLLQKMLNSK